MFYNMSYILYVMLPTMIISALAQMWLTNAYNKWSNVANARRVTGLDTGRHLMTQGGVQRVDLQIAQGGQLSDHFDPGAKTVRLSPKVAHEASIASMAIAAHEFGHVQQYQENSPMIAIRSLMIPTAKWGPQFGMIMIIAGAFMQFFGLAVLGLILFAGATAFTLATLPIEFNASTRAMKLMRETGLIQTEQDAQGARAVLTAAAFTYVAATLTALIQLLYYANWVQQMFNNDRR